MICQIQAEGADEVRLQFVSAAKLASRSFGWDPSQMRRTTGSGAEGNATNLGRQHPWSFCKFDSSPLGGTSQCGGSCDRELGAMFLAGAAVPSP